MKKSNYDTIAAIATPSGEGGVGIVRISGERAFSIATQIFHLKKQKKSIRKLPTHTLHYGKVVSGGRLVDEGLLAIMRAPHSYTTEDVIEIQAHGGIIPLERILRLAVDKGARLAQPGEFTRRAFINGRMDLAQAEAVVDLIRAKTDFAYENALCQLSGLLSDKIRKCRQKLLKILTKIEANIDFPEQSGVVLGKSCEKALEEVKNTVAELVKTSEKGRILKEGYKAVIVGRPNVGKSSLMNALLRTKRVIVASIPGTTRDIIEETINLGGIPLRIADTAGIRKSRKLIEVQGTRQSRAYLEKADLVVLVVDGSQRLKPEDFAVIREIKAKKRKVIIAVNKIDLPAQISLTELKKFFPSCAIAMISAKYLNGMPGFLQKLRLIMGINGRLARNLGRKAVNEKENVLVSRLRHKIALKNTQEALENGLGALKKGLSGEFVAFDLWRAVKPLEEILGISYKKDLLNNIFQEFCVGK